jgi:hypothetical protein
MSSYNTSTFSNLEGASDRIAQRKVLVAKLHQDFNGEPSLVVQFLASVRHRCEQTRVVADFDFIIKENPTPPTVDLTDPEQLQKWLTDPDRFQYGNLLYDASMATMENIQAMRDIVRRTVKVIRAKPKAKSKEAEHLVSYQNRQWLYDLFMNSWSASMTSTMSKYLESHDGDGVVLLYCFILHFAGASTENIIQAYQQLTETVFQRAS